MKNYKMVFPVNPSYVPEGIHKLQFTLSKNGFVFLYAYFTFRIAEEVY